MKVRIKPDFFAHEGLADLSFAHRLGFIGLWTLADKEGRLEDRPKQIKIKLFPYDSIDIEPILEDLAMGGFIVRHEIEGKSYIVIPTFIKHQRPHRFS